MSRAAKKAQVATEFLLIIAFLLLVFLAFFGVISMLIKDVEETHDKEIAEQLISYFLKEMKQAYASGDGFTKLFKIDKKLRNKNYTISFNGSIAITLAGNSYVKALPSYVKATSYYNNFHPEEPSFYIWNIRNNNGTVSLSLCTNCSFSYYQCLKNGSTSASCTAMDSIYQGFSKTCCYGYGLCC